MSNSPRLWLFMTIVRSGWAGDLRGQSVLGRWRARAPGAQEGPRKTPRRAHGEPAGSEGADASGGRRFAQSAERVVEFAVPDAVEKALPLVAFVDQDPA